MNTTITTGLGIAFLVLGLSTVFLMFHLWGYPFDKATRTSAAPKGLMILHRILGFLYVGVYIAMMWMMVPRMWTYQVEFPPRTVAHIILGLTIGFILIIKISIIRFFRHLEEWMPYLGTLLLFCTVLLLGLSLPFTFKERHFASKVCRVERHCSLDAVSAARRDDLDPVAGESLVMGDFDGSPRRAGEAARGTIRRPSSPAP